MKTTNKMKGLTKTLLHLLSCTALTFLPTVGWGQTNITSLSSIGSSGHYVITADIDASGFTTIASFSGTLEANINPATHMPYRIKNLGAPLFTTLTGTVRNLVIEKATISQSGMVGAVACTASSTARIYNVGILGGTVKSTGTSTANSSADCCGGLVGLLDGTARVVNCYSYADITGGNRVGGIVGYNNVETKSNNLKTMVFCCMFYGNIAAGAKKAPIYNGKIITNRGDQSGVSNFNYFWAGAEFMQDETQTPNYVYNCALMAETRFLNRFEFYRHLLNGHRELAGWWVTGTYSGDGMHKWVMLPDSIGSGHPFPILMEAGRYPSVVNIDAEHATTGKPRNQGGKLGTLTVNIQMGDGVVYNHPGTGDNEAQITTSQLTLNITDKDTAHFNYNYYKVQLPYYNDVGTKNYTGNRVVTGWKIVNIIGGTPGTFSTSTTDAPSYNFADRNCTNKDLYSVSGRIFNQGAYWDVPEGVTTITIEPYWAKCVYLSDPNADKAYNQEMATGYDVPNVGGGKKYTSGNSYPIAGENQLVYTTRNAAISSSSPPLFSGYTDSQRNNHSVYDYAVMLVGNYHDYGSLESSNNKPYTITSIDLDGDNEPDYSYILRFDGRTATHPVRADFINIPGLGMAQKSTGGKGSYNLGILQPKGWFESTNTSLFRVTQFEYDRSDRGAAPYIVQGGVIEQWVSGQNNGAANNTTYFHVGGNVWFKEFHRGTHQDKTLQSKHPPVSVTGGDYDEFYLTGLYTANVTSFHDNAECYINGGRFGTVCGAAMEGIGKTNGADNTGNITWQIQNADIHEFYAGGLNAAKPAEGNLSTTIVGSHVDIFCGGPKFGDMNTGKTVTTVATDCTFGTFFGAGYGGNSYSRYPPRNHNQITNFPHNDSEAGNDASWNAWLSRFYTQKYNSTYTGVSTQFSYQFLPFSNNKTNVARIFVDFVKFSLATTRNVTSTLTGCTVLKNFYGGGSLGKVDGNVTSTLTDCIVKGNVFGAGYSASLPPVQVDSIGFRTQPFYYEQLGTYREGKKGATVTYTWQQTASEMRIADANDDASKTQRAIDQENHILYTDTDLSKTNLGSVTGTVTLTINGNSVIGTEGDNKTGNVYGGGDESAVSNTSHPENAKTEVVIEGNTHILGHVFAGGNNGVVSGGTKITVKDTTAEP